MLSFQEFINEAVQGELDFYETPKFIVKPAEGDTMYPYLANEYFSNKGTDIHRQQNTRAINLTGHKKDYTVYR